jgi:glycosyltransferase involved in cell wall biosynthesis
VGWLVPRKGFVHLLDAVARLRATGQPVALDVVGDGPLRSVLRARVEATGLQAAVAFHGTVPHGPALFDFFRRADVFVLPSVAGEGVPRAIQEAMAASCPVVATDVGSVRQQLADGRFGAVVPPGDPEALSVEIARVISDADLRRARIADGFEEALRFSFENQRRRIRSILEANVDAALLTGSDQISADRNSRTRSTT